MANSLPMKTTEVDLEKLSGYLRSQVGWVPLEKIRKAIPAKHANSMKVEAMRHLGLIERDGENVKLTAEGREFAGGDAGHRAEIMRKLLKANDLYGATIEWMHFNDKTNATKNDVANYWHDNHAAEIGGAQGDALTDPAVFFMRMIAVAGLGKFTPAGVGRETNIALDPAGIAAFATGDTAEDVPESGDDDAAPRRSRQDQGRGSIALGPELNVNVEIHIAADAKPATIEEIFKNMRKYLLGEPEASADGG